MTPEELTTEVRNYQYASVYRNRAPLATTNPHVTENERVHRFRRAVKERLEKMGRQAFEFDRWLTPVAAAFRQGYEAGRSDGYDEGSRDGDYTTIQKQSEEIASLRHMVDQHNQSVENAGEEIRLLRGELQTEREENDDLRMLLRECTDKQGTDALKARIKSLELEAASLRQDRDSSNRRLVVEAGKVSKAVYDGVVARLKEAEQKIKDLEYVVSETQRGNRRYQEFVDTVYDALEAMKTDAGL